MGQRRAGNGVSELHGCLYVVGEWMVFVLVYLVWFVAVYTMIVSKTTHIILDLGSNGVVLRFAFEVLRFTFMFFVYTFIFHI